MIDPTDIERILDGIRQIRKNELLKVINKILLAIQDEADKQRVLQILRDEVDELDNR